MTDLKKIFLLCLVALVAWVTAALYSLKLNPEILFYRNLSAIQKAWSTGLRSKTKNQFILIGGSSALFSVMPERSWERHGVPLANLGLAAGIGPQVMVLRALEQAKSGDTLLIGIEPGLLTEGEEPSALGIQYAFAIGRPGWICEPALRIPSVSWGSALLTLRPGGYHMVTLAGKILTFKPLYRYQIKDVSQGGWVSTDRTETPDQAPGHGPRLSRESIQLLESLTRHAKERRVRVIYTLPWAYCPPEKADSFRRKNAKYLMQVDNLLPVLLDPRLGAVTDWQFFADSSWHLNADGSRLRTDELAAQLHKFTTWHRSDLEKLAGIK